MMKLKELFDKLNELNKEIYNFGRKHTYIKRDLYERIMEHVKDYNVKVVVDATKNY